MEKKLPMSCTRVGEGVHVDSQDSNETNRDVIERVERYVKLSDTTSNTERLCS